MIRPPRMAASPFGLRFATSMKPRPTASFAVIGDIALVDDFAIRLQGHANRVLRITKIDSDDVLGRWCFHNEAVYHIAQAQPNLPSHLLLLVIFYLLMS